MASVIFILPPTTDERGTMILIFICSINVFFLYPCTKLYYIWRNRQRAKVWDAMTCEASRWTMTEHQGKADCVPFSGERVLSEYYKRRRE